LYATHANPLSFIRLSYKNFRNLCNYYIDFWSRIINQELEINSIYCYANFMPKYFEWVWQTREEWNNFEEQEEVNNHRVWLLKSLTFACDCEIINLINSWMHWFDIFFKFFCNFLCASREQVEWKIIARSKSNWTLIYIE
jgi:hypothetical protein